MAWKKELPTTPGVYWYRYRIRLADDRNRYIGVIDYNDENATTLVFIRPGDAERYSMDFLREEGVEWYGPIKPPSE